MRSTSSKLTASPAGRRAGWCEWKLGWPGRRFDVGGRRALGHHGVSARLRQRAASATAERAEQRPLRIAAHAGAVQVFLQRVMAGQGVRLAALLAQPAVLGEDVLHPHRQSGADTPMPGSPLLFLIERWHGGNLKVAAQLH